MPGVPGRGGPPPKRADQRRRNNKGPAIDTAPATVNVKQPPLRSGIHPTARKWYRSLRTSGQAEFYTDSDWQTAVVATEALNLFFATGRATLLAEFNRMCAALLVTEGDRRRARLELQPTGPEEVPDNAADIEEARRRIRACN